MADTVPVHLRSHITPCLKPEPLPPTPEKQRRFAGIRHGPPGQRVVHWGRADLAVDNDRVYGMRTQQTRAEEGARAVLRPREQPPLLQAVQAQKESVYKSARRMPLGRSYQRGFNMPPADVRFGVQSDASEDAGKLLNPEPVPEAAAHPVMATSIRVAPRVEAGEQRVRRYQWSGLDPATATFGRFDAGTRRQGGGASECLQWDTPQSCGSRVVTRAVAQQHQRQYGELGRCKAASEATAAMVATDVRFGMPSVTPDQFGAGDLIHNSSAPGITEPDPTVGRGRRNPELPSDLEQRVFGVPSIRTDMPPPAKRSLANTQNFGDETGADGLCRPSRFAYIGVFDEDMEARRSLDDLLDIVGSAGIRVPQDPHTLQAVMRHAIALHSGVWNEDEPQTASLTNFRRALYSTQF